VRALGTHRFCWFCLWAPALVPAAG